MAKPKTKIEAFDDTTFMVGGKIYPKNDFAVSYLDVVATSARVAGIKFKLVSTILGVDSPIPNYVSHTDFSDSENVAFDDFSEFTRSITNILTVPINPVNYKEYVCLIGWDPSNGFYAEVLRNTLGANVAWARTSAGLYIGTATANVFTLLRTTVLSVQAAGNGSGLPIALITGRNTVNSIYVIQSTSNGTRIDGLAQTTIEIKVYL